MSVHFEVQRYYGQWRWVLYHQNGSLLAQSNGYSRKRDVKRAIGSLKKIKLGKADVTEQLAKSTSGLYS